MPPLTRARAASEAPPTLLDALARAPAAAALVVAALEEADDRKALRLVHTQLRDAVGESTTKLEAEFLFRPELIIYNPRAPTARRWPRLEELTLIFFTMRAVNVATLEALASEAWPGLHTLRVKAAHPWATVRGPAALALAAALRRMPALRALELWGRAAAALAALARGAAAPQLRSLTVWSSMDFEEDEEEEEEEEELGPAALLALAASGWRLESLDLWGNGRVSAASLKALAAAPTFSIRRLHLHNCELDAASLLCVAKAPWPLEELVFWKNDLSDDAAGPALVALSRSTRLRRLNVSSCALSAAGSKALVETAWPALTCLTAHGAKVVFNGPHALDAAAFGGFPALEELGLSGVALGEAGARLLASRRWARLRVLKLAGAGLGDAGLAALARGAWPALRSLSLGCAAGFAAPPTLEGVRRWAPALAELEVYY